MDTPLRGMIVAITSSRRAGDLAHIISSFGGIPYVAPTVGIDLRQKESKEYLNFLNTLLDNKFDYIIFMTGLSVYSLIATAKNWGLEKKIIDFLNQVVVIARSSKPKEALAKHGIKTDIVPVDNTTEGIVKLLENHSVMNKKVAIIWPGSYSTILKDHLVKAGATVFEYSNYSYSIDINEIGPNLLEKMGFNYVPTDEGKVVQLIKDVNSGRINVITFTSPPAVHDLFYLAVVKKMKQSLQISLNKYVVVAAVGPSTARALKENGINVDVVPEIYKMGPMIKSISNYLGKSSHLKIRKQRRHYLGRI
jgi:uroporphyrinogen-III synthase